MPGLVIMRGLPASGKTTWARSWVSEEPGNRVRVNRDDLRMMAHDGLFVKGTTEKSIIKLRNAAIRSALKLGNSVVCDDTNLPSRTVTELLYIARELNATVRVEDLTHVPVDVCAARNYARGATVPETVIHDMWMRYLNGKPSPLPVPELPAAGALYKPYAHLPRAVIFDIDGTLAHMDGRSPYDDTLLHTDTPDEVVKELYWMYRHKGYSVIIMSGREGTPRCRKATEYWLDEYIDSRPLLIMRPEGDNRRDSVVKLELFDKHVRHSYNVTCVFDDRNQVVDMWRSIGLKCLQVQPGDF